MDKVDALIDAGHLDEELRPLIDHLLTVRNAFAHRLQTELTVEQGRNAYQKLPERARSRTSALLTPDSSPGRIVRWCFAVIWARIRNRALHGNTADLPYA